MNVDYAQRVLAQGYERAWHNWFLDAPKAVRAGRPYVYGSPYRPTVHIIDANVAAVAGGMRALVFMARPLTLEELEQHDLIPINDIAIGTLILDTAKAANRAVELAHADGVRVALLFKNPRGVWQLSYFEDGVGPTGHMESADPVMLAAGAWRSGFRRFTSGMVDDIVGSLGGLQGRHEQPMERLFYIHMPGCPTCAAIRPIIRRFRDTHPDVKLVAIDITAVAWEAKRWIPQVTPTLVRLDAEGRYHVFDGYPAADGHGRVITPNEVRAWLLRNFS